MGKLNSIVKMAAGAATGALLGILFAPKKGEDMRQEISNKSMDYTKEAKDEVGNFFYNMTEELDHAKANVADRITDARKNFTKSIKAKFR